MSKSADAFRTISEVADWLGVQTHVLRFWESKFTQIKPVKRAGGRRYYRPADMLLLGGIRKLLHDDGMTIKGVQKLLREEGMAYVSDMSAALDDETAAQVDNEIVPEADFVEAEMAPEPAESTVTAFAPMTRAEPEETADEPVAEQPSAELEEEPVTLAEPPEPALLSYDEAEPEPILSTPEPQVALPSEAEVAEVEDEPAAAAPIQFEQEETTTPPPVFARTPDPAPPVPSADLVDEQDAPVELPSFLTGRRSDPNPEPDASLQDSIASAPAAASVPPKPKPRIISVPDEPDTAMMNVAPSALAKAARITHLRHNQRAAIQPLLKQLTALRDQMANAGRDAR